MINNVSFSGRETMLTSAIKKGAQEVNVVKASSILPELPKTFVEIPVAKTVYTSPFAPIANVPAGEEVAKTASKHIDIFA